MRLRFGDVEFDAARRRARRLSVDVHLSVKAFERLKLLVPGARENTRAWRAASMILDDDAGEGIG